MTRENHLEGGTILRCLHHQRSQQITILEKTRGRRLMRLAKEGGGADEGGGGGSCFRISPNNQRGGKKYEKTRRRPALIVPLGKLHQKRKTLTYHRYKMSSRS